MSGRIFASGWSFRLQRCARCRAHATRSDRERAMKKTAGFLAVAAAVAMALPAEAQICAGYPTGDRGLYFGARADFPENVDSYGVEANYNFSGPLGVYGGLNVLSAEDEEDGDES